MAEHTLILLRHAKSDWSGDEADIDRPLARRGRRQAPEAGRWLVTHVARIDLAVVSTARRAGATWDLVSAELGVQPETRHDDDAYAGSVLVGHKPGLEDLGAGGDRARRPVAERRSHVWFEAGGRAPTQGLDQVPSGSGAAPAAGRAPGPASCSRAAPVVVTRPSAAGS